MAQISFSLYDAKTFFFKTKTKKGSKLARLSNNLPDSHHDGEKIKGKD